MASAAGGKGAAYSATIEAGLRPAASPLEGAQFDAAVAHSTVDRLRRKADKAEQHLRDARQALAEAEKNAKAADKAVADARKAEKATDGDGS